MPLAARIYRISLLKERQTCRYTLSALPLWNGRGFCYPGLCKSFNTLISVACYTWSDLDTELRFDGCDECWCNSRECASRYDGIFSRHTWSLPHLCFPCDVWETTNAGTLFFLSKIFTVFSPVLVVLHCHKPILVVMGCIVCDMARTSVLSSLAANPGKEAYYFSMFSEEKNLSVIWILIDQNTCMCSKDAF